MTLAEYLATHKPKGFTPGVPQFSPDGGFVNVYFADERCYTERVSDFVDVFRSMRTKEIVGCRVWGVSKRDGGTK